MGAFVSTGLTTAAPATAPREAALIETYAQFPLRLVSGRGARVVADDGREYWDFYGGHAVALLGHSHPAVTAAISAQARTLAFYSNAVPLEIRDRAANELAEFAPEPLKRVFFCNSGAEANENALKLALQFSGRTRIAALSSAFHGRTLLALAATDGAKLHRGVEHALCSTVRLPPNDIGALGELSEDVAAMILEPVQSMAGVIELTPEYLVALRARCDGLGIVLIYDEVQTGMGRLGVPLAAGRHGVLPDMVTLAKGLGNGVPIGALLIARSLAERIGPGDLGSTFGGGPLACAALLAVLGVLRQEDLVNHAARIGTYAREHFVGGVVTEVRGRGCLLGLRMRRPAKEIQHQLLERGFIVGTSGPADVVRLLPPLNTPAAALHELAVALRGLE